MQIFVSYASEDRALTEQAALALSGAGHNVFFDRSSLPAGGDFHSRILTAIGNADLVVFMASVHSLASGAYTLTELKFARDKWPHPKGRVLTVRLPGVAFDSMPAYLKSVTVKRSKDAKRRRLRHLSKRLLTSSIFATLLQPRLK